MKKKILATILTCAILVTPASTFADMIDKHANHTVSYIYRIQRLLLVLHILTLKTFERKRNVNAKGHKP